MTGTSIIPSILVFFGLYLGSAAYADECYECFGHAVQYVTIGEEGEILFENEFLGNRKIGGLDKLEARISEAKGTRQSPGGLRKIHVYAHENVTNGEIIPVLDTLAKAGFPENTFEVLTESKFYDWERTNEYIFGPLVREERSVFEEKFADQCSLIQPSSKFKFTSPFAHSEVNKKYR